MNESEPYSATYAPLVRQKVIGWWAGHQVVIFIVCLSILMYNISLLKYSIFSPQCIILIAVIIFDLCVVHRLSLWQILGLKLGILIRSATGKSRSTVSPITAGDQVASLQIPGPRNRDIKEYKIINSGRYNGACWLWSRSRGEATASLKFLSDGSELAKFDEKNARGDEFSKMLHGLTEYPDVVRITLQSRALLKPTQVGVEQHVDSVAGRDLTYVEEKTVPYTLNHDYILSVTLAPDKAPNASRHPGVEEVSKLMVRRMTSVFNMIAALNVSKNTARWLNAGQLRGEMKSEVDPQVGQFLDQYGCLSDDVPVQTAWREYSDYMTVGPSFARTYWIDVWPDQHPVYSDWLESINGQAQMQLLFTQVFRPRSEKQAKESLDSKSSETGLFNVANRMLGRPDDKKAVLELQNLERRRVENSREGGDVLFQGFFTVIAQNKETLEKNCQQLQETTQKNNMHLDHQIDQQLARWVGALPLGLEGTL